MMVRVTRVREQAPFASTSATSFVLGPRCAVV